MKHSTSLQPSFTAWLSSLRQVCGHFDSQPPQRDMPFFGQVGTMRAQGLEVAKIRTNARRIARRVVRKDGQDAAFCFLIFQHTGRSRLHQQGQVLDMLPGEMCLVDSAENFDVLPDGLIEHISFHLPRTTVAERLPQGRIPFGKLSSASPSGQVLYTIVRRIASKQWLITNDSQEGEALRDAMIALLPPLVRDMVASEPSLDEATKLYHRACQLIDQHLQEVDLAPADIAGHLHISLRQLYRLFEAHGNLTIKRFIQRSRLNRCAEDLADPSQRHRSITEIAFQWGFADSAHFSRSFKKAFDCSPRDYQQKQFCNVLDTQKKAHGIWTN